MAEDQQEETSETEEQETEEQQDERHEVPPEVARALKKANKEAETLRRKLKEIEDKDKSEAERTADRLREVEQNLSAAQLRAARAEVGADKGLPKAMWGRLQGDTPEELATDADALLAAIKPSTSGSFDAGTKQSAPPGADDMNALIRRSVGRA
jgi:DNA repair exonuclease SbcCD ATPase subunit